MAGSTLGVVSLDPVKLKRKHLEGSEHEKRQAAMILPVLASHHHLLVTLLLCNAAANEALPIFMNYLVDEQTSILISITCVLVFGEILPSAIMTGPSQMRIAAFLSPLIRVLLIVTSPISWPVAKLLDCWLGHEGEANDDADEILQRQLARVHELRATEYVSAALIRKIGRTRNDSPTDKKLFTHDTWAQHAGLSPFNRWKKYVTGWRSSSVLRAVLSRTAFVTAWTGVVVLLGSRLPISPVALQLQGTAIGLVLAFRNNAAYERLAEARALMGKVITLGREIASGAITFLAPDEQDGYPTAEAYRLVRYMAVFGWVLKARLRDGEVAEDVLRAVLSNEEVGWLLKQRSPTVAIIGQIRRLLHTQYANGKLAAHLHSKLELNLLELYAVVGGIERLFTSPIPPTMTRHVVRSLCLWLLAMPLALVGSMPPLAVVFFTTATAYIFLGIEELGVQVEQPFDILPLWQICHLATRNVEEAAFAHHDTWPSSHRPVAELPPYDVLTFGRGPVWTSVPLPETAS